MLTELTAALTGIKTAGSIAKAILGEAKEFAVREKVGDLQNILIDLQGVLLDLQARMLTLHDEKAALKASLHEKEAEIENYKRWDEEKGRYKLTRLTSGTQAYLRQAADGDDTPAHYLCPQCFEARRKSILQPVTLGGVEYRCHSCGGKFVMG